MHRASKDFGRALALRLAVGLLLPAGCHVGHASPSPQTGPGPRDSYRAQQLNRQGFALIEEGNFEGAEERFREALEADVFCGPAHNNLGLALLHQGKPYQSAWQFNWAARLMPQSSQPHNNLGLLFEGIGKLDRAMEAYETALQVDSDDLQAVQHLARTLIKAGRNEPKLNELLEAICYRSEEKDWSDWAREQLLRLGRTRD